MTYNVFGDTLNLTQPNKISNYTDQNQHVTSQTAALVQYNI